MSILVPAFLTAVNVARNRPLIVVSSDEWIKFKRSNDSYSKARLLILQILIVFPLTPFVPGLIMTSEQKAIDRRKAIKDKIDQRQTVSVCAHFFEHAHVRVQKYVFGCVNAYFSSWAYTTCEFHNNMFKDI